MSDFQNPFQEPKKEPSCASKVLGCIDFVFWKIVFFPVIIVFGVDLDDNEDHQPLRTHHRIGTSQPPPQLRM
tara:strand:- start:3254 stop:3469 length:216 start_codon:yes stop_codon:yes gene_type:complete